MKGIFITFEGSEGCGKSTQSRMLCAYLRKQGYPLVYLREPGGTNLGEKIRRLLLSPLSRIGPAAETLLYMAARAEAVDEVIRPALKAKKVVICDRFLDSTIVYQGSGLAVALPAIKSMGRFVTSGVSPQLTILLDLPLKKALGYRSLKKDRIEQRSLSYHRRVRAAYLRLAAQAPSRIKVVKVEADKSGTQRKIRELVDKLLSKGQLR